MKNRNETFRCTLSCYSAFQQRQTYVIQPPKTDGSYIIFPEKKRKRFLFPLPSGEASLLWAKEDVKPCLTRWEQTRLLLINGSAWVLYVAVSIFSNLTCETVRVCYIMQSTVEDVYPCFFSLLQHLLVIVLRLDKHASNNQIWRDGFK